MGIVVKEQDILNKEPPHATGVWGENDIRGYQESHGINYGSTVYQRGVKPNREWSNDMRFDGQVMVEEKNEPTIASLMAEIEQLKAEKEEKEEVHIPSFGVERHGLDKRTKEYKESVK